MYRILVSTIDLLSTVDDLVLMTLSDKINEYNNLLPLLKKLFLTLVKKIKLNNT